MYNAKNRVETTTDKYPQQMPTVAIFALLLLFDGVFFAYFKYIFPNIIAGIPVNTPKIRLDIPNTKLNL